MKLENKSEECSANFQRTFGEYSQKINIIFRKCSANGTECSTNVPRMYNECSANVQRMFGEFSANIRRFFLENFKKMLKKL